MSLTLAFHALCFSLTSTISSTNMLGVGPGIWNNHHHAGAGQWSNFTNSSTSAAILAGCGVLNPSPPHTWRTWILQTVQRTKQRGTVTMVSITAKRLWSLQSHRPQEPWVQRLPCSSIFHHLNLTALTRWEEAVLFAKRTITFLLQFHFCRNIRSFANGLHFTQWNQTFLLTKCFECIWKIQKSLLHWDNCSL